MMIILDRPWLYRRHLIDEADDVLLCLVKVLKKTEAEVVKIDRLGENLTEASDVEVI